MNALISDFGAVSGGTVLNTAPIQNAIDAVAENGGGRVTVPAGTYLTGSLFLKDNVELHLEAGAVLKASERLEDYNEPDAYPENWGSEKEEWTGRHLIIAHKKKNVAITGAGTVDGSGKAFFEEPHPCKSFHYIWGYGIAKAKDKIHLRPGQLLVFVECEDVLLTDLTLRDSPCWTVYFYGCERIRVRGLSIQNNPCHANTDGINIDTCRFVTVSDCIIHTGDDAFAIRAACNRLQSGKRLCEHVTISNCILSSSAMAVRIGVGSGIIRSVKISGLVISRAAAVASLMTSYKKNGCTEISDILIENVVADEISFPFQFLQDNEAIIRNVRIGNVMVKAMCSTLLKAENAGLIQNVAIQNLLVEMIPSPYPPEERALAEKGDYALWAKGVSDLRLREAEYRIPDSLASQWKGLFWEEGCSSLSLTDCNFSQRKS